MEPRKQSPSGSIDAARGGVDTAPAMSSKKQKKNGQSKLEDLARTVIDRVDAHDLEGMETLSHPDLFEDVIAVGPLDGREAVQRFFGETFSAFPDFHIEIDRVIAADATACVQWRLSGTFTGTPFQGIRANGARVELRGVDVMEFEDGLLRRNTVYYDGATFARAVGMLPAQGSLGERAMLGGFNVFTSARQMLHR